MERILDSNFQTGFRGFLNNIISLGTIIDEYISTYKIKFILTYNFSQDHLELFSGLMRTRVGSNDNPTAKLFTATYKE